MHEKIFGIYDQINWTYQVLIFANVIDCFLSQFSTSPKLKGWKHSSTATYICPNTIHRLYKTKNQYIDSANLDNIICFAVDVDYKNSQKKDFGDMYLALLDAGIPPSLIVDTPHGYHVWFLLQQPLVMRWKQDQDDNKWQLRPEAEKALSWYRSIQMALIHRFISLGYPADRIANSPARLFRNPTEQNILHLDLGQRYTMNQLSDTLESWVLDRSITVPAFRRILTTNFEGVREGRRNAIGCKVALALVSEYGEIGLQHFLSWCDRCDPPYPHDEARAVWRSVLKKWDKGEISYVRRENIRTRQEQGPYARKIYSSKVDEKIAKAIIEMQAQGCPDPWNYPRALAKKSDIPEATIKSKKAELLKK